MGVKLHICPACKLPSKYLLVQRLMKKVDGIWTVKFYVLCGCKKDDHPLYNSEDEAAQAWNKAHEEMGLHQKAN
jgi:hypothetical protein